MLEQFLLFLSSLVGTVSVIHTSLLSCVVTVYRMVYTHKIHLCNARLPKPALPVSPNQLFPRLHSCTHESLTFCGLHFHPSWSLCSWPLWHSWGLCDVTAKSNRLLACSDRSSKGSSVPKLNISTASPSALAPCTVSVER